MGLVYIFTNPCLENWVKIGMTDEDTIKNRLYNMNRYENLPLPFRCYATFKVENAGDVESAIHKLIDKVDPLLHAQAKLESGKVRKREFFKISPDRAFEIFQIIAEHLKVGETPIRTLPTQKDVREESVAEVSRRDNTNFASLNIVVGTEIKFLYDSTKVATVVDVANKVKYEGQIYSVSGLASKLLVELGNWGEETSVNGWRYFTVEGRVLKEIREENELGK